MLTRKNRKAELLLDRAHQLLVCNDNVNLLGGNTKWHGEEHVTSSDAAERDDVVVNAGSKP
jgi:hypothetical protein